MTWLIDHLPHLACALTLLLGLTLLVRSVRADEEARREARNRERWRRYERELSNRHR